MTKREMNLKIFRGEELSEILFQPRMEPWFAWHKQFNTLPAEFQHDTLLDFYDRLDVSMRYIHYYSDIPDPVVREFSDKVKIHQRQKDDLLTITYHTPLGSMTEVQKWTIDQKAEMALREHCVFFQSGKFFKRRCFYRRPRRTAVLAAQKSIPGFVPDLDEIAGFYLCIDGCS
jgi:hypothetical protein